MCCSLHKCIWFYYAIARTLDGVRSLPLEDGTFCQPRTTRPTISPTLCQISVFKIGLKCWWGSNHILCQPPSCHLSCVEIVNNYSGYQRHHEIFRTYLKRKFTNFITWQCSESYQILHTINRLQKVTRVYQFSRFSKLSKVSGNVFIDDFMNTMCED